MKEEIIADLGSNYRADRESVLDDKIKDVTARALFISNRKTSDGLELPIKEAIKSLYLLSGTEDVENLSESGRSAKFKDVMATLERDVSSLGRRIF